MIELKVVLLQQVWVHLLVQLLSWLILLVYEIFQVLFALSLGPLDRILSVFLTPVLSLGVNFLHLILTFQHCLLVSQLTGIVNLLSVHFCIVIHIGFVPGLDF